MTVICIVQYRLTETKTNHLVYEREIKTPYTAKFSDDFAGVTRMKDANEGAARENITALIKDLYRLKIKNGIRT